MGDVNNIFLFEVNFLFFKWLCDFDANKRF